MFNDLSRMGKYLGQAARMLVGMPDYDTYVEHMRNKHPDKPVMTYEEFFRERQEARYGGGKGRPITSDVARVFSGSCACPK
ncbi:YbdD/YjiX family protein [Pseudomonas aeruginosa]|uniref:YbdD/YjiX family protein n=1 Tax=Pseudomonas aeruginosa TaxID=287 RepID=UPI0015E68EED|nr:YbdD/YjiX family protein [Pseudomonas aeruginosa]